MARELTEQELEIMLREAGLITGQPLGRTGLPQLAQRPSHSLPRLGQGISPSAIAWEPPQMATPHGGGFRQQLMTGLGSPLTLIQRKTGILPDKRVDPYTTWERTGRLVGELVGWGLVGALTAATLGKGTAALALGKGSLAAGKAAVAKGGLAVSIAKGVPTAATIGGLSAWDRDLPPGEIARSAGYGAALGAAMPLLGHVTAGVRGDIANRLRMLHTRWQSRWHPESKSIVSQLYSRENLVNMAKGANPALARDIMAKAGPRLPKALINKMPPGTPDEQLRYVVQALSGEPGASEALRPLMRELIPVAHRMRQYALSSDTGIRLSTIPEYDTRILGAVKGSRRAAEYVADKSVRKTLRTSQKALHDAGVLKGKIVPPKEFGKMTLQQQLRWVEGRMKSLAQARGRLAPNVRDPAYLGDSDRALWESSVRATDELMIARYRMMGQVEAVLRGTKKGFYPRALDPAIYESAEEIRGKYSVEFRYPVNDRLKAILAREKVMFPSELKGKAKQEYRMIKETLPKIGEKVDEVSGHIFNYDELFPKPVHNYLREQIVRFQAVKPPTSYDDAIRFKPAGLWETLLTPKRSYFGEAMTREFRMALSGRRTFESGWARRIDEVTRGISPKERTNITHWLWAEDKDAYLRKLKAAGGVWTSRTEKAAIESQRMFRELAKVFDLDEKYLIKNYAPRISDGQHVMRWVGRGDEPAYLKAFFEYERTGHLFPKQDDIHSLLNLYVRAGARKKFLDPVFKMADREWDPRAYARRLHQEASDFLREWAPEGKKRAKPGELPKAQQPVYKKLVEAAKEAQRRAKILESQLQPSGTRLGRAEVYKAMKRSVLGWPTETEQMVNTTIGSVGKVLFGLDPQKRHTREILSYLAQAQYTSTLGWNLFSPIKNLTQQILPMAHLDNNPLVGVRYWMKAYKALASEKGRHTAAHTNFILPNRMSHQALSFQDGSIRNLRPMVQSAVDKSFTPFKAADRLNVAVSHMMKLMYDLDKGVPMKAAIERANSFTMATQFMYGFDSPMLYSGPLGQSLGVLMSWPLNYAHLIREQFGQAAAMKAATMVGMGVIGAETLSATGMSFRSAHPMETASGILPIAMLEGEDSWPILPRAVMAGGSLVKALYDGDPEGTQWAWQDFRRKALYTLIPFFVQGRRTVDFYDTVQNDWQKFDARERLRHDVTKGEAFRGLFGPTVEAQWRRENFHIVQQTKATQQRIRTQAMEAMFDGDYETFWKKQDLLVLLFGKGVEDHEVRQELERRGTHSLERFAQGLPQAVRTPLLERLKERER